MVFSKAVTVAASTLSATPLITPWALMSGLIYRFELTFPPGPSGLVGVALKEASHKLYPIDDDEYLLGDNITIAFDDLYMFEIATKQLEIVAYNNDDYYSHTFYCRLGIETNPELIKSRYMATNVELLTSRISALVTLLTLQATASGKYSSDVLEEL